MVTYDFEIFLELYGSLMGIDLRSTVHQVCHYTTAFVTPVMEHRLERDITKTFFNFENSILLLYYHRQIHSISNVNLIAGNKDLLIKLFVHEWNKKK